MIINYNIQPIYSDTLPAYMPRLKENLEKEPDEESLSLAEKKADKKINNTILENVFGGLENHPESFLDDLFVDFFHKLTIESVNYNELAQMLYSLSQIGNEGSSEDSSDSTVDVFSQDEQTLRRLFHNQLSYGIMRSFDSQFRRETMLFSGNILSLIRNAKSDNLTNEESDYDFI